MAVVGDEYSQSKQQLFIANLRLFSVEWCCLTFDQTVEVVENERKGTAEESTDGAFGVFEETQAGILVVLGVVCLVLLHPTFFLEAEVTPISGAMKMGGPVPEEFAPLGVTVVGSGKPDEAFALDHLVSRVVLPMHFDLCRVQQHFVTLVLHCIKHVTFLV